MLRLCSLLLAFALPAAAGASKSNEAGRQTPSLVHAPAIPVLPGQAALPLSATTAHVQLRPQPAEQRSARLLLTLLQDPLTSPAAAPALKRLPAGQSASALVANLHLDLSQRAQAEAPDAALAAALGRIDRFYSWSAPRSDSQASVAAPPDSTPRQSLARFSRKPLPAPALVALAIPPTAAAPPASDEGPIVRLAVLWHFVTIAAMTIIGAVKQGLLMYRFGEAALPLVYIGSAMVTGLAVAVYNHYSTRVSRRSLIGGTLTALAVSLAAWIPAIAAFGSLGGVAFAFSLWTDVFSIMAVTLFWTYMSDTFTPEGAKRHFGFIGAAGPVGSIIGSAMTLLGAVRLGQSPLLAAAALLFASSIALFALLERLPHPKPAAATVPLAAAPEAPRQGIIRTILASPFLIFLALLVIFERMVPDISNYLFNAVTRAHFPTSEAFMRFQGFFGLAQGTVSLAASVLLTRTALRVLGIGGSLMTAPLANLAGMLLFPFFPGLPLIVGYNGVEGLLRYTWFKSAKEATYTAADRDVIYRVKAFIEMFLYRFARGLAGLLLLFLTGNAFLGLGLKAAAAAGAVLAASWVYVAWRMGAEVGPLSSADGPKGS